MIEAGKFMFAGVKSHNKNAIVYIKVQYTSRSPREGSHYIVRKEAREELKNNKNYL